MKKILRIALLVIIGACGLSAVFLGHKVIGFSIFGVAWIISNFYDMNWSKIQFSDLPKQLLDHLNNKDKNQKK